MWKQAIENHKTLMAARPDPSDWANNICDSSSILTTPTDWQIYYRYLTQSPIFFNSTSEGKTMGELEQTPVIPAYSECQTIEEIKNGNETYILVKTVENDEKTEG